MLIQANSLKLKRLKLKGMVLLGFLAFLLISYFVQGEKQVTINFDGQEICGVTQCVTVGGLLREKEIIWHEGDLVKPAPDQILKPKEIIFVQKCVPFIIEADATQYSLSHYSFDAAEVVRAAGISMGSLDKVAGTVDKENLPVRLKVIRVERELVEEEEMIPFERRQILEPQLKKGESRLVQQGETGLIRRAVLLQRENGVETGKMVINEEIQKEVVPEITALGTKGTQLVASRGTINLRNTLMLQATAYTHTGNTTFTGVYPRVGTIAVDPALIPLGSKMWVEGYGFGIAQDTGGLIKGKIIDLFMDTQRECLHWGRRNVKVYILE